MNFFFLQKEFWSIKIILAAIGVLIALGRIGGGAYYALKSPAGETETSAGKLTTEKNQVAPSSGLDILDKNDLLYSFYAGFDALSISDETQLEKIFKVAKEELRLNYLRVLFSWKFTETEQNKFDWARTDIVAKLSEKYKISVFAFFPQSGTPSWAAKDLPENCLNGCEKVTKEPDYYAKFISEFLKRYKHKMNIKYVELENEPNAYRLWPDTAKYLAEVDNAVYAKVKSVFPDVKVCSASVHQPRGFGGNLSEEHKYSEDFVNEYLNNLEKIDCFSIHDYGHLGFTQTYNQYKYATQYDLENNYRQLLNKYKFNAPIIFTECTYGSDLFGEAAPATLIQGYILSHAKGIAQGRMCGSLTSGLIGISKPYALFDVNTGERTDSYYAFKTMRNTMTEYSKYVKRVNGEINGKDYFVEQFQNKDKEDLYVAFVPLVWKEFGMPANALPSSQSATINIGYGESAIVVAMKGEESKKTADSSGNIQLTVGAEPVYVKVCERDSYCEVSEQHQIQDAVQQIQQQIQQSGGQQQGSAPQGNKCGDGTCDSVEKQAGVCPEDCGTSSGQQTQPSSGGQQQGSAPQGNKCGDGTCDSVEKQAGVCLEDCK